MSMSVDPVSNANANNPLGGGLKRAYYAENGTAAPVKIPRSSNFPSAFPNDLPSMNIDTGTPEMSTASKLSNATIQYVRMVSPVDSYALRNDNFDDLQPQSLVFVDYEEKLLPPKLAPTSQELCSISGMIWINRQLKELPFTANDAVRINYAPTYTDDDGNDQVRHTTPWAQAIYDMKREIEVKGVNQPDSNTFVEALEVLNRWRLDGVLLTSDVTEYRQYPTESNMPLAFNVAVKGDVLIRNGNESPRIYLDQIPINAPHGYSKNHQFDAHVRCGHSLYVGVHVEKHPSVSNRYIYQLRLWSSRLFAKYDTLNVTNTTTEEDIKLTKSLICMVGAWRVGTVKDSRASINAKTTLDAAESIQCGITVNIQWMPIERLRLRETTFPKAIHYGYGFYGDQQLIGFVGYNANMLLGNIGTSGCKLNTTATKKLKKIQTKFANVLNYMFVSKTTSNLVPQAMINAWISSIMNDTVDMLVFEKVTNVMATEPIGVPLNQASQNAVKRITQLIDVIQVFLTKMSSSINFKAHAKRLQLDTNRIIQHVQEFHKRNMDQYDVCTPVPSTKTTLDSFVSSSGRGYDLPPYFNDIHQERETKLTDLTKFLTVIDDELTAFVVKFKSFYDIFQDDLVTFDMSWNEARQKAEAVFKNTSTIKLSTYAENPLDAKHSNEFASAVENVESLVREFNDLYNKANEQKDQLLLMDNNKSSNSLDLTTPVVFQTFVAQYETKLKEFNGFLTKCDTSYQTLEQLISSDKKYQISTAENVKKDEYDKVEELKSFWLYADKRLNQYTEEMTNMKTTQPQSVSTNAFPGVGTVMKSGAASAAGTAGAAKPASRSTGTIGANTSSLYPKAPVTAVANDSREQSPLRQSSATSTKKTGSKVPSVSAQPPQSSSSNQSESTQRRTRSAPVAPKTVPAPPTNPMADSDDEFF